jgi:hypothetical protein
MVFRYSSKGQHVIEAHRDVCDQDLHDCLPQRLTWRASRVLGVRAERTCPDLGVERGTSGGVPDHQN